MMTIEAAGLTKSFGAVTALDGLDLGVAAGQVCALLGPNGAGKTTAVRILATLTRPDAGRASVAGYDVARQPGLARASIGLVGQHAAVDDDLTGQENLVIIGLMLHLGRRAARQRAAALLAEFELADAGGRLVKTWSGGMRRRLDLMASLIIAPPVLILDEPTTGLDPRSRAEIWSTVRGLARGGTTVLLSTQYLAEADEIADTVVIIDGGRVVAHGSPDELKDAIGTRVDIILADAADLGAAAAVLSRWATAAPSEDPDRRRITAPVPAGAVSLPELVRQLDSAGLEAHDVSVRRPTLDEVFLDRTGPAGVAEAAA
jgi:ABC-2 type transport system ATP-binding protein